MNYRFYLLDENEHIRAGESFTASDDAQATEVAAAVHSACSDVFDGYELWRGNARVAKTRRTRHVSSSAQEIVEARQENVLDLMDRLQRTFTCVRESRRLLQVTSYLTTGQRVQR
jgi:hypothetical protein